MAVSRVGGTFLAEAVKPKHGGIFSAVMQYGGNVLAVSGFSIFGGNSLAVGGIYQNMAVTGTAHQGGNFTAGKIPTTTLKKLHLVHPTFDIPGSDYPTHVQQSYSYQVPQLRHFSTRAGRSSAVNIPMIVLRLI